jgi:hypothetical protein
MSIFFGFHFNETIAQGAWTTGNNISTDNFASGAKFGCKFFSFCFE